MLFTANKNGFGYTRGTQYDITRHETTGQALLGGEYTVVEFRFTNEQGQGVIVCPVVFGEDFVYADDGIDRVAPDTEDQGFTIEFPGKAQFNDWALTYEQAVQKRDTYRRLYGLGELGVILDSDGYKVPA